MQDIFNFEEQGEDEDGRVIGEYIPGGMRPNCEQRLKTHGFKLPATMFMNNTSGRGGALNRRLR
jgi:pilus assembly protein CpaF